jgi:ribonuclease-3
LADVFEAVLAAIFLDGGMEAATSFVHSALGDELTNADPREAAAADFKTMLQESLQADHHGVPQYKVIETSGPPHKRVFEVEVRWATGRVRGHGRTIKAAEMAAAQLALETIAAAQKEMTHTLETNAGDSTPATQPHA